VLGDPLVHSQGSKVGVAVSETKGREIVGHSDLIQCDRDPGAAKHR